VKFTIYRHTNKLSGKCYIGQTRQPPRTRWAQHVYDARTGHDDTYFHRAIRKYGRDVFLLSVLEEVGTLEAANEAEQRWIGYFRATDRRFGYNLELGGAVKSPSEETRRKQSVAQKKRFAQPGALALLSAAVKATHPGISEENRRRVKEKSTGSTWNRGRKHGPHSEAHRAKIAASKKGRTGPHTLRVRQFDGDQFVADHASLTAAAMVVGCAPATIARCARGHVSTVGGFVWRFYP